MSQETEKTQEVPAVNAAALNADKLKREFLGGISWFYWIGGLSIVNVFMAHYAQRKFIVGLGATELIDTLAFAGSKGSVPLIALSVAVSLAFVGLGYAGRKGKKSLILAGLVFYGIDALILAKFSDWLGILFHAYAGYSIFKGYQALAKITSALK